MSRITSVFSTRIAARLALALAFTFLMPSVVLRANVPALWPTFSQPTTVSTVDLRPYGTNNMLNPDFLAQVTLMGAYNQLQLNTRIFIIGNSTSAYWLSQLMPSTVTLSPLSWNESDQNGVLKAMLSSYGSSIKGAIVYDPANSESINVATTLAGIDDAMVISPTEEPIVQSYNVPILADLRTNFWIGSDATLVGNTTINKISNPSGGNGTTGWGLAYDGTGASLTTSSGSLLWTVNGNLGHDDWVQYSPTLTAGYTYIFSVQLHGTGQAYLDGWDGTTDWSTSQITLSSTPQTLQLAITIPQSSGTPQFEVRTDGVNAATVYIQNAAVVRNRVASEQWSYENLLKSTNKTIMTILNPAVDDLRDYVVASKMMIFDLSSDNADESALMSNIIAYTPHNTPILGYIDDEANDVPFLSSSSLGHFLNASDYFDNESIWASLPGPTSLTESTAPAAVKAQNGYVYVGSWVSDGDNAQFVQGAEKDNWTNSQFLGAVPLAWTEPPGMLAYAPLMLAHDNTQLPQSSELMSGPSGIGYATANTDSDLTTFGQLTGEAMTAAGMSTVTDWFVNSSNVIPFVEAATPPHDVHVNAYAYTLQGNTVIDGQVVGYNDPESQVSQIESVGWSSTAPTFIEALSSGWGITADDALYIAQRLQTETGHNYVFLTPSELALTEKAYYGNNESGLPNSNTQAVLGSQLVSAFPHYVNYNGSGADGTVGLGGAFHMSSNSIAGMSLTNTTYNGQGAAVFQVPANLGYDVWALTASGGQALANYIFTVNVAGTGQAYLDVWDGNEDHYTAPVTLTSSWQTLRLCVTMASTAGQIQIRVHSQSTPTTVYFQNASFYVPNWQISSPGASGSTVLSRTSYQNGPAVLFEVASSLGHDEWTQSLPHVVAGSTYTFSVDVAGTGEAFLDAWNGTEDIQSPTVALTSAYQTLTTTATIASSGTPLIQVRAPSQSGGATIYFRNASVFLNNFTSKFATGLEPNDPQPTWTSTVDTASGGGGDSNVSSETLTLAGSGQTHGGGNDLLYSGTAAGGTTNYAYMKVFGPSSVTLDANTILSYWVYPQSPKGSEPNASESTGTNSTCVAIDIVFTDGTNLRDSGVTDQYGNQLHPAHECNHLQPDQWNYVTANLGALSGKTISTIDVGYDQPGGSGNYRGYVDDIHITN